MYRWPVRRRHGEKTLQAEQRGGSAEADAKRVAIVVRRHAKPARQALFTEGPHGVEPGYSEQEHDRAENERRSEEHTSELQSHLNLVCRLLLEKKNTKM